MRLVPQMRSYVLSWSHAGAHCMPPWCQDGTGEDCYLTPVCAMGGPSASQLRAAKRRMCAATVPDACCQGLQWGCDG